MTDSLALDVIIVERLGNLKLLSIKDFKKDELYKKGGFKKADNFIKQVEWKVKYDGIKYFISVYAKSEGRANYENKYEFPPPIDTKLFYGSCVITAETILNKEKVNSKKYTNLSLSLWNKIYEKLFGGFEDLKTLAKEDEEDEDELENIPKKYKTKHGYLKDGFVVDSSDRGEDSYETSKTGEDFIDTGSELSEEAYNYEK